MKLKKGNLKNEIVFNLKKMELKCIECEFEEQEEIKPADNLITLTVRLRILH